MTNTKSETECSAACDCYAAPCPFCNGQPEQDTVSGDGGFFTRCEESCVFYSRLAYIGGQRCPIEVWNTRFVSGIKVVPCKQADNGEFVPSA